MATDETLCIEDGVCGIRMECVLGTLSNPETIQCWGSACGKWAHSRSSSVKLTQEGVMRWP